MTFKCIKQYIIKCKNIILNKYILFFFKHNMMSHSVTKKTSISQSLLIDKGNRQRIYHPNRDLNNYNLAAFNVERISFN